MLWYTAMYYTVLCRATQIFQPLRAKKDSVQKGRHVVLVFLVVIWRERDTVSPTRLLDTRQGAFKRCLAEFILGKRRVSATVLSSHHGVVGGDSQRKPRFFARNIDRQGDR